MVFRENIPGLQRQCGARDDLVALTDFSLMQIVSEQHDEANIEGYDLDSWDQIEARRCLTYVICLFFE